MNPTVTRQIRAYALAAALVILSSVELWQSYVDPEGFQIAARLAFLALAPCLMSRFGVREWSLTALALALSIGLMTRQNGFSDVLYALDRAAFFAAFIYLVTLLKEAAERSKSVLALGKYMTQQPPGRRYYALSLGGHFMGVILNFGAISLLAPLIQRGSRAAEQDGDLTPAQGKKQEQQQLSALLRGFAWMIIWSPTTLTQAILFTSIPGSNTALVMSLGLAASVTMILIGRAVDKLYWQSAPIPAFNDPAGFPADAVKRFATVCLFLVVLTAIVVFGFDVPAAISLMLVAPVVMVLWLLAQNLTQGLRKALQATGKALREVLLVAAQAPAQSAYILGMAGFIGEAAAKLAPVAEVAEHLNLDAMPDWLFLSLLPFIITLCGQIALSPILVVVFLSAVVNELPTLPADPNLIIFALGVGWALGTFASPNASATLLISGITGIPPTTLTWRWNGLYALCCYGAFVFAFWVLTMLL